MEKRAIALKCSLMSTGLKSQTLTTHKLNLLVLYWGPRSYFLATLVSPFIKNQQLSSSDLEKTQARPLQMEYEH